MALVHSLWNMASFGEIPEFREPPFDLGTFDQIAHHRGGRGSRAASFEAGFSTSISSRDNPRDSKVFQKYEFSFHKKDFFPFPVEWRTEYNGSWIRCDEGADNQFNVQCGTPNGNWETTLPMYRYNLPEHPFHSFANTSKVFFNSLTPMSGSQNPSEEDQSLLMKTGERKLLPGRPCVSAPIRFKPSRTYYPSRSQDRIVEGEYIVSYLAGISASRKDMWSEIQAELEQVGKLTGLFDEFTIGHSSDDVSVEVRIKKYGKGLKGPWRNIVDVGYGVSQALPVIFELLFDEEAPLFMFQQPEIHLHPSAQAALASFLCKHASWQKQIIVETHSDHLVDRVRIDVRDGNTILIPEEVSILYFERDGLEVIIHSLGIDAEGNIINIDENGNDIAVPESYRRFFLEETTRSLGL
ncbi:MAG: AAA family ATPase [Chloroflexi bacterium]|nr:AAA family ATPase [Chloroflexota bacterium]